MDDFKNVAHVPMMTAKSKSWLDSLKPLENLYFSMLLIPEVRSFHNLQIAPTEDGYYVIYEISS